MKDKTIFDETLYKAILRTGDACGISIMPLRKAARLMAIIYVWGGGDEQFTGSPKLKADVEYIQEKYQLYGGGVPPVDFVLALQADVLALEDYIEKHRGENSQCPEWAKEFMKEYYNFVMKGV